MTRRQPSAFRGGSRRAAGFTLIEVMIAILVLGVGLLGFALLQTMSVRFTKSAQQRTVATTLAYEVIDMMRIQRADSGLFAYNAISFDSFGDDVEAGSCDRDADADIAANIERWKCEVKTALPGGAADIDLNPNGDVRVRVRWGDAHWGSADEANTTFELQTRI